MCNIRSLLLTALSLLVALPAVAGTVVRPNKPNGTTAWQDGDTITAAGLNGDIDNLVTAVNGQLENDNIKAAASIHGSKLDQTAASGTDAATDGIDADIIDDYSATDNESDDISDPGTADSRTLATNLQEEIAQLRYKIEELTIGTSATAVASGTGTDTIAHWADGPIRPGNHIYNGGFDAWQQADCSPCAASEGGWDLVLTPDLADTALTEADGAGDGMGMLITANGAALEGISQTIDGLKADTRYLAIAHVKPTTGDSCRMLTTGADTNQLSVDSASDNAFEIISGVFETDSTPTNVVLQLLAVADGDICLFDDVGVFEINTDPVPYQPKLVLQDCATQNHAVDDAAPTDFDGDSVEIAVTPPGPNYSIEVYGFASADCIGGSVTCDLELAIDENGVDVMTSIGGGSDAGQNAFAAANYVLEEPTPGTTYTYKLQVGESDNPEASFVVANQDACITVRMSRGF
jgi:hypothetical protein